MKRFFIVFLIVFLVIVAVRKSHRIEIRRDVDAHHRAERGLREAHHALRKAGDEVRDSLREARDDLRRTYHDLRDEMHDAFRANDSDLSDERIETDDLPVPILKGTHTTEAAAVNEPRPRADEAAVEGSSKSVEGLLSATQERAQTEARTALNRFVTEWLSPEIPSTWTPPQSLVDSVIEGTKTTAIKKEYGEVFLTTLRIDASPERRTLFTREYNRELVHRRLVVMGGGFAFLLVCLGAISSYIRADEATRGYYTQKLRLLAAAGVGAAGVLIYQFTA